MSETERHKINFNNERLVMAGKKHLESQLQSQVQNILFLSSVSTDAVTSLPKESAVAGLVDIFSRFIKIHPNVQQVRFIDLKGMEVVRVDRVDGRPYIVPKNQLQNKSARYYFNDARSLSDRDVVISRLDLNVEKGEIVFPYQPVIRLSSPIFNRNDHRLGVLVVNFSAQEIIDHLRQIPSNLNQSLWMADERLDWIIAPKGQSSWATQLNLKGQNLKTYMPELLKPNGSDLKVIQGYMKAVGRGLYIEDSTPFRFESNSLNDNVAINRASRFYLIASQPLPDSWFSRLYGYTPISTLFIGLMIVVLAVAFIVGSGRYRRQVLIQKNHYQRELMKRFFEHSPEMLMIVNVRGEVLYCNSNAEQLLQAEDVERPQSSVGVLDSLERQLLWNQCIQETAPGLKCEVRLIQGEKSRYFFRQCFFIDNEDGNETLMAVVLSELTQFKEAERKRRDTETKIHRLLDAAPDAIFLSSEKGQILLANRKAQQLFEMSESQLLNLSIDSLVPTDFKAAHHKLRKQYFDTPSGSMMSSERQVLAQSASGRKFEVEVTLSPIKQNGENQVISIVRDISERVKMQSRLKQTQKLDAMGQLTGGVAHDFNNFLTTIIGNLDLAASELKQTEPEHKQAVKYLNTALNASLNASCLTKRLLAFSRKQPLYPQRENLGNLLERELDIFHSAAGKAVQIHFESAKNHWLVMIDPQQFTSAIINLVVNAKDAMPQGGRISIEVEDVVLDKKYLESINETASPGEYVLLRFSDTGVGISSQHLEKVFEPFYTTKDKSKGTGLGLSMLFGFVKQSNGFLKVSSKQGAGTRFQLYFPRVL